MTASLREGQMESFVKDVMNPELFHLRPSDSVEDALNGLLAFGIAGAPVLDEAGRPLGMVSLRELAQRRIGQAVSEIMTSPTLVVSREATATEGARTLAESGHHRLVVVDDEGHAVGNVSALDLLRALLGLSPTRPAAFPHLDRAHGVVWGAPAPLELSAVEALPDAPGVLALLRAEVSGREHVVWAEAARDVHARLVDLLARPQTDKPVLAFWLARGGLRFSCARVDDAAAAHEAIQSLARA